MRDRPTSLSFAYAACRPSSTFCDFKSATAQNLQMDESFDRLFAQPARGNKALVLQILHRTVCSDAKQQLYKERRWLQNLQTYNLSSC